MRPVLPTASLKPAATLPPGLSVTSACNCRSGAPWSKSTSEEGAYLSAQIKPKAERTAAELHRNIGEVLHAHIARSDQMGEIVASHGLTGLY